MTRTGPSLAIAKPELALEWHPSKNGVLSPNDVSAASKYKAWWLCAAGHEWQQGVGTRVLSSRSCPLCALEKNNLSVLYPEIARQWHSANNGGMKPDEVAAKSKKRAWWKCERNPAHVWEATISSRTILGSGCPYCHGMKVDKSNSLATLCPDIAAQWHPTKNKDLRPEDVAKGSDKKAWWQCEENEGHEWQTKVTNRTYQGSGCPFCNGRYLVEENQLSVRHPEIAQEWHPTKNRRLWSSPNAWHDLKNEHLPPDKRPLKNRRLQPSDVASGSSEYAWWQCRKDEDHVWTAAINKRVRGDGCPFCAGLRVTKENNLEARYPGVAKQWHPTRNRPLTPADVMPGSRIEVWWRCFKAATHVWQAPIARVVRARKEKNSGCPFCRGLLVAEDNSLAARYPAVAQQWHPSRNKPLLPSQITPGSIKVVWWKCPSEHAWQATVTSVVKSGKKSRTGCPYCAGKKVAADSSLAAVFPMVARQWDYDRNQLLPKQVTPRSTKVVWWQCSRGHKSWQEKVCVVVAAWKNARNPCPSCTAKTRSRKASSRH